MGPAGSGRSVAACVESWRVQIAVVLRRRFGVARHRHAGDEPAWADCGGSMPWTAGLVRARGDRRFRIAAAQRFCQRMAGLSRPIRCDDQQGSRRAWAAMPAAIMLAMAGALALASFAKAGAIDFPRRSAHAGRRRRRSECGLLDARADAGAGVCVRRHWPGADFVLAGGVTRRGQLASGMGVDAKCPRRWPRWVRLSACPGHSGRWRRARCCGGKCAPTACAAD